jgi:hypothetical protein
VSAWAPHKDNRSANGVHEYKSHTSEENLTRRVTDTLCSRENLMALAQLGDTIQYILILSATMNTLP